jgi:hypothetical protein
MRSRLMPVKRARSVLERGWICAPDPANARRASAPVNWGKLRNLSEPLRRGHRPPRAFTNKRYEPRDRDRRLCEELV